MAATANQGTSTSVESAMLSIHFYSLGREGQVGAAPSILLPLDLEPMPLDEALDTIRASQNRRLWREAAWTLLRGTPHPPFGARATKYALRYPVALRYFCDAEEIDFPLDEFDDRRDRYRKDARVFAAALVAFTLEEDHAFEALRCAVEERDQKPDGFGAALRETRALGGEIGEERSALDFLRIIGGLDSKPRQCDTESSRTRCRESLSRLEDEVGVSLETYIGEFADTVAFIQTWRERHVYDAAQPVTVYPALTVAVQDTRTLTTLVTATSLVTATDFRLLACGVDPLNWGRLSTTFRDVHYVDESAHPKEDVGMSHGPTLLREEVRIVSREDRADMGYFDNLLWVQLAVHEDEDGNRKKGWANLDFTLHQSIRSRLLWDERPGGLLVDGGWTKLRSVVDGLWRVTSRKVLRFKDRTPESSRDGPLDFGQALNYHAPSALSAWLESDIYGGQDPEFVVTELRGKASA